MIYSKDDELIDCEYLRQKSFVRDFLGQFDAEIAAARARNFTAAAVAAGPPRLRRHHSGQRGHHSSSSSSGELSETLADFRAITGVDVPPAYATEDEDASMSGTTPASAADAFGLRAVEYRELGARHEIPEDLRPLMKYAALKQQCDERHRQMKRIVHDMQSGDESKQAAASEHLER